MCGSNRWRRALIHRHRTLAGDGLLLRCSHVLPIAKAEIDLARGQHVFCDNLIVHVGVGDNFDCLGTPAQNLVALPLEKIIELQAFQVEILHHLATINPLGVFELEFFLFLRSHGQVGPMNLTLHFLVFLVGHLTDVEL